MPITSYSDAGTACRAWHFHPDVEFTQAYAVGSADPQQLAARQEVQKQLHSADEAVVPFCLVSVMDTKQTVPAQPDYQQCGSASISLQVSIAY